MWVEGCADLKNCDLIIYEKLKDETPVVSIPHLHILARKVEPKIMF